MLAVEDPFEAIERQMIDVLRHDDVREQAFGRQRPLDGLRRRGCGDDAVVTVRTGILRPHRFDHADPRRHVVEFLGDGFADPGLDRAAGAPTLSASGTSISTRWRGSCGGSGRRPVGRAGRRCCLPGPLARVHLGRFVARLQLLGQLREGQTELVGADALGFLPEEFLAEDVELLAERGVLARRPA